MPKKTKGLIPENKILKIILVIRVENVILDSDLAALYGVETRRLNEQVRRNKDKFPEDFMFQLTQEEFANLKSQIATSSLGWGGRRKAPLVFTEHGALQRAKKTGGATLPIFDFQPLGKSLGTIAGKLLEAHHQEHGCESVATNEHLSGSSAFVVS